MPTIRIQRPTDQPTARLRLLDELRAHLNSDDFHTFRIITAFAKAGPLRRLQADLESWRAAGKKVFAIIGIDQRGTSIEALQLCLELTDETYVAHLPGFFSPTFHPKIYLFEGAATAVGYVGSNNLTVGGTETNLESFVRVDLELPADEETLADLRACWDDALRVALELDGHLLNELTDAGLVASERAGSVRGSATRMAAAQEIGFPGLATTPPSALPRSSLAPRGAARTQQVAGGGGTETRPRSRTLVMQIRPHQNGEVLLSMTAVDQNPAFFEFPFTGRTTPKIAKNPAYPQRLPDPVVDINVYDDIGRLAIQHQTYALNTVFYEGRDEFRITIPQDVVNACPEYSLLVMRIPEQEDLDYVLDIYVPGSSDYVGLLSACNQTMPSGGKPVARRFGWL